MRKFFKKHKRVVGVILLVLALGFFAFWELIGRSELLYSNIVVLNSDVLKGTEITKDMLKYIKIDSLGAIKNCITDQNDIIGLEAKHFIPAGTQLVSNYFDIPSLVLKDDEKIMNLPNGWIHSFPETLRRKDNVYIYAVEPIKNNTYINNISTDNNIKEANYLSKETNIELKRIYIFATTVAHVKDNSNKEVSSMDDDRLVGSSTISNIEIVVNDEQFELLRSYAQEGYTFVLMYTK